MAVFATAALVACSSGEPPEIGGGTGAVRVISEFAGDVYADGARQVFSLTLDDRSAKPRRAGDGTVRFTGLPAATYTLHAGQRPCTSPECDEVGDLTDTCEADLVLGAGIEATVRVTFTAGQACVIATS